MRTVVGILIVAVLAWFAWTKFSSSPQTPVTEQVPEPAAIGNAEPENKATDQSAGVDADIAEIDAIDEGPRRIEVNDQADFFSIMAELGLTEMEQRFSDWSLDRGYPFSDQTGVLLLEQPYDQYDNETLMGLAQNEDMWAQQFLAKRLERTRPAEAIDWYRKAAINGSIYAMDRLTSLYSKLGRARADGANTDAIYKEQLLAVRDTVESTDELSYAWSMASVMAGGDPGRSRMTLDTLSRNFDEEQQQRACDMASSLYSDISGERESRGLADFSRSPPPMMMGSFDDASSLPCGDSVTVPQLDTRSCEELIMVVAGTETPMVVCRD